MTNPVQRAIERACADAGYRARLLADPRAALAEEGAQVPDAVEVRVHESSDDRILVVLPANAQEWAGPARAPKDGPVADVPAGLKLAWKDGTLFAEGHVDATTAPALRRELLRTFVDTDVDLFRVEFLSSAGMSALLAGQKHLRAHDRQLRLRRVRDEIMNVLEMVGLVDLFEIDNRDPGDPFPYFGPWGHKRK